MLLHRRSCRPPCCVSWTLSLFWGLLVTGCDSPRPEGDPLPADSESVHYELFPDALLVRFEDVRGKGLSRESWEIEILQMGEEIRVRGSVKSPGSSIPIYRSMSQNEYAQFWGWLQNFPLDRYQVEEDPDAAEEGWRKTLHVDVVLGPEKRLRSESRWTRPLLDAAWLQELEDRLHLMALDFAEEEVDRLMSAPPDGETTEAMTREVLELLREDGDG